MADQTASPHQVEPKREVRLRCIDCGREWAFATLPMEIGAFAKRTKAARCECGAGASMLRLAPSTGVEPADV
jgi:hypothetical protein